MFSPEDQQVAICLLKSNLEEIENDLVNQLSALPALEAENEQKYRATMEAVRIARSLNSEIDRYKQENLRLTAKRMQLKQQCENIRAEVEKARQTRSELVDLLKEEESSSELAIRNYEDSLREKAERFRKTRRFYNEQEISDETVQIDNTITELEAQATELKNNVSFLKQELNSLQPDIPENLLTILGKEDMDEKLNELMKIYEQLLEEKNSLFK